MFPWGVLITGVVGVGGTALGAWLNSRAQTKTLRLSLDAENERARLAEKRRMYAACLTAFNELIASVSDYRTTVELTAEIQPETDTDVDKLQARLETNFNRMNKARNAVIDTISEIELIASSDIGDQARDVRLFLTNFAHSGSDIEEEVSKNPGARGMRTKLLKAMRADLGETD